MKPQPLDPKLYHDFLEMFLYKPSSIAVAKQMFMSRAPSTWKIYRRAALKIWKQSSIVGVPFFPLTTNKLLRILGSVKNGKWPARHWLQVRQYLGVVCSLNGDELDSRVNHLIQGQAKQNVVQLARKKPRPVFTPIEMRRMLFRVISLKKSHAQQRALLAILLAYFAVGRSFDISHLRGDNMEFGEDYIRIHYHVRKNNPLALKRHVATIYSSFNFTCPVLNILKGLAYLKIGPSDYIFHREGDKSQRMDPATIIQGVKNIQKRAGCHPQLTLTDVRASATTALVEGGVNSYHIMLWGNWQTDQLQAYARSNEKLKRSIQTFL